MSKITKERHARIVKTLQTKTNKQAARIHKISYKTASRIRRGGERFVGYLLVLEKDHPSHHSFDGMPYEVLQPKKPKDNPIKTTITFRIKQFFEKIGSSLWDESEKER